MGLFLLSPEVFKLHLPPKTSAVLSLFPEVPELCPFSKMLEFPPSTEIPAMLSPSHKEPEVHLLPEVSDACPALPTLMRPLQFCEVFALV